MEDNNIKNDIQNESDIVDDKVEESIDEQEVSEVDIKIGEIELKLQEIEVKIDAIEFNNPELEALSEEELVEYQKLKEEQKELIKEIRLIKKEAKKKLTDENIENVSIWIFIYGLIIDIVSFPFIAYIIYLNFGSFLINQFAKIPSLELTGFFPNLLLWLIVFALPIILVLLSWFLFNNVTKKRIDKKVFSIFWIIQTAFTLASIIWLTIKLFA